VQVAHTQFRDAAVARNGRERITHDVLDVGFSHEPVRHRGVARIHEIEGFRWSRTQHRQ